MFTQSELEVLAVDTGHIIKSVFLDPEQLRLRESILEKIKLAGIPEVVDKVDDQSVPRCENPFCAQNYQAANGTFCVSQVMTCCQALARYRLLTHGHELSKELLVAYQQAMNKIDDYFEYAYRADRPDEVRDRVMTIIDNLTQEIKRAMAHDAERAVHA